MKLTHVDAKSVPASWFGHQVQVSVTRDELAGHAPDKDPDKRELPTLTVFGGLSDMEAGVRHNKGLTILYVAGDRIVVPNDRTVTLQTGDLT